MSCSKSGRAKRSEEAKYFQASDVEILGLSPGGENTWNVEFAVLFPSVDGQAPQPLAPDDLVQMVDKNKESIEGAVGGSIKRITIGNLFFFVRFYTSIFGASCTLRNVVRIVLLEKWMPAWSGLLVSRYV